MSQHGVVLLLYEIGLLIIVSSLATELFKRLRLPGLIGPVLVGIFIGGPGGIGLVTDLTVVNILAVLGSVLILFMTGLEFEASTFWTASRKAFLLTTIGVIASFIVGYLIGLSLGWSQQAAFFLGAVLAPSGTSVVAAVLSSHAKTETKMGSTLLAACVLDDVEGVILLSIALGSIGRERFATTNILLTGVYSVLFVFVSIYFGSKVFPRVFLKFSRGLSDEVITATLLGFGLILAFASTQVGLAAITGAFIMGSIIPYRKLGEKLASRLLATKEIFASVFFTSIGLSINPYDMPRILPVSLVILASAIGARFVGGVAGGRLGGFRGKPLLAMTLGLAIRAEMSLIVAREAVAAGVVGNEFLALAAAVVIGSMIVVSPILSKLVRSMS